MAESPRSTADQLASGRADVVAKAIQLEALTVAWLVIEAVVTIASGVAAHSLSLLAFGIDSVIELISAFVLLWRLGIERRHGAAMSERAERLASRIGGALLLALSAYIVVSAALSLWQGRGEVFSPLGLVVVALTIPVMYGLARAKLRLADRLGSRALRLDAIESIACLYLSVVVVLGLVTQFLLGAWWIDSVTALALVWFLVKEGREAWRGEECCEGETP
jgi:divalent metal cation (Fe/Co/Zn/Cd) transporter